MRQAGNKPAGDRIGVLRHDNRNRGSCVLDGTGCCRTTRDNDVNLEIHQLGRERGETIEFSLCKSPLYDNVFPLHVSKLTQTLLESFYAGDESGTGKTNE